MSRYGISAAGLAALCLLITALVSCRAEVVGDPATPTVAPADTATVSAPPAPLPTRTLTPGPPTAATPTYTVPSPGEDGNGEHIVRAGDTLLGIATTYGVPMAAIQLQNGMGDSTVVQVGQVLSIPPSTGWEGASRFWVIHVVKAGETLVGIARAFELESAELKAVNGLADADLIVVGQELVIPLDGPAVVRTSAPASTNTPAPLPAPSHTPTLSYPNTPTLTPLSPAAPTAPVVSPPADVSAWPRETVRLINQVRAQHGLPPLAYNETLAQAAQGQADDCAQRGWCSHTGSDGSDIKTRIQRAGYDPASWAECWAQRQTPQGAVDIWMDEVPPNDPHRRTLLTTWLFEIGVGVAQTDWGYYFIADFGRPRE
jgi:uncharacterized protein YkwD